MSDQQPTSPDSKKPTRPTWLIYVIGLPLAAVLLMLVPVALRGMILVGYVLVVLILGGSGTRQPIIELLRDVGGPLLRFANRLNGRRVGYTAFALGGLLACAATLAFAEGAPESFARGFVFAAGSILSLGLGWWLVPLELTTALPIPARLPRTDPDFGVLVARSMLVVIGIILLFLLTVVNMLPGFIPGDEIIYHPLWPVSSHAQMLMLNSGIFMLLVGLIGAKRPHIHWETHHTLLLLIFIAALALRLYKLDDGIHHLVDEVHFVNGLVDLRDNLFQRTLMPFSSITAFTYLYPYAEYLTVSLLGPSLFSLRLVSAIVGAVQVFAVYFLAKTLFDRPTALLSALIIAVFAPHLHFSRIALNNIADPLVGVLMLAFLARGLKQGRSVDYALAGMMLGLSHYFYEGGRVFYTAFAFCWIAWVVLTRHRNTDEVKVPTLQNLVVLLVMFAAMTLPLYATWIANHNPLFPRFAKVGVDEEDIMARLNHRGGAVEGLLLAIRNPLLAIVSVHDQGSFYKGRLPMVLDYFVVFLLIGFAYSFWRVRRLGGSLLLWWVIGTVFANSFISNGMNYARFVIIFPALAILIALGLRSAFALTLQAWVRNQVVWKGALVGVALFLCIDQAAYYLNVHMPAYYYDQFYYQYGADSTLLMDAEDALFRSVGLPPKTWLHIVTEGSISMHELHGIRRFWGRDDLRFTVVDPQIFQGDYLVMMPSDVPHAFFLPPDDTESLAVIQRYFTVQEPQFSPFNIPPEKQFALFFAPVADD